MLVGDKTLAKKTDQGEDFSEDFVLGLLVIEWNDLVVGERRGADGRGR